MMELQFNHNDYVVRIKPVESYNSMNAALLANNYAFWQVIGETEYHSKYLIIEYYSLGEKPCAVGLAFNSVGLVPQFTPILNTDTLAIGYNSRIAFVNLANHTVEADISLGSPSFFCKCLPKAMAVLAEIDIYILSYTGEVIKSYPQKGMILDCRFVNAELLFTVEGRADLMKIDLSDYV